MKKIIEKYWKLVLLATIAIFIIIPLNIIVNKDAIIQTKNAYIQNSTGAEAEQIAEFADEYLNQEIQAMLFSKLNVAILLIFPVVLSSQIFKDTKGQKPTKALFACEVLFIAIPYILNAIALVIIKFFGNFYDFLSLMHIFQWLLISNILGAFMLACANVIGCFAKNVVQHVTSVYVFLFAPVLIIFAFETLLKSIIYGFVGLSSTFSSVLTEWPAIKMFQLFSYNSASGMYLSNFGIGHGIVYILLIIALFYITYRLLPKMREYKFIPIVTTYVVVIVSTLIFTSAFSALMNIFLATFIALAVSAALFALCVLFVKEKNIKKLAIGYGIYSIVMLLLILVVQWGMGWYENRIPNADEVEYAVYSTINPLTTDSIKFTEAENIQCIIDRQKELVQARDMSKNTAKRDYYIQYVLKNGDTITRVYNIVPVYEKLYDSEEYIKQRYSAIFDEKIVERLSEIEVLGIYNDKAFGIKLTKENELFKEAISAIANDITNYKAYRVIGDEYKFNAKKEGIQYLLVDISFGDSVIQGYAAYATIEENYALVGIVQKLIDEESKLVEWE